MIFSDLIIFKERKFKIVHIVKGSINSVWKAWNDVELRKTYDPAYELANVVERVDDSCDGELLLLVVYSVIIIIIILASW